MIFYVGGKTVFMERIGRISKGIQHIPNESQVYLYSQLN